MDFNREYAAHQHALMRAERTDCVNDRRVHLGRASLIAGRISFLQRQLGAAAACAWNVAHVSTRGVA